MRAVSHGPPGGSGSECLALSQDVLLHGPLHPLAHEALHMHVWNGACHNLIDTQEAVHLIGQQGRLREQDAHDLLAGGTLARSVLSDTGLC